MRTTLEIPDPSLRTLLEENQLVRYEDFIDRCDGEPLRAGGRNRRITLNDGGQSRGFFLKVYRYGSRSALRRERASIEAENYRFLQRDCGIDVPDVVAFGSRRCGLRLMDAFILTREVENSVSLEEWPPGPVSDRRTLLLQSADLVRTMHDAGFFHIDLQWRNLLLRRTEGEFRLYLIDSSRGGRRQWKIGREHGRIRDLSSLSKEAARRLSRTERLRWLRRYFRIDRMGPLERGVVHTIERDRASKDNSARGQTHDHADLL